MGFYFNNFLYWVLKKLEPFIKKHKCTIFLALIFLLFPSLAFAKAEGFPLKEILIQVFNFSVFAIVFVFLVKKPIGAFFHKKQKDFIAFEEQALQLEKEKEKEQKEWDKKLMDLEQKEKSIQQSAQQEGERLLAQKKEELKNLSNQLKSTAEFFIRLEREKLKRNLIQKWRSKVAEEAEEDLKQQPKTSDFQNKRLKEFLKQMETQI